MIYDVIIIGLGAAGTSAAIYAKRAGLNVAVINFQTPGGVMNETTIIENYPGFKSITGPELAFHFFEHFNTFNIPLFNEEVIDIKDGKVKKILTDKHEYKAKKIIICSGRKPRKLGIENEEKFIGNGISYCTICDGNLYKDKNVIVIGGGNSALESALYLSEICNNITILVRNDKFIGNKILLEEVTNKKNIKVKFNTNLEQLILENKKIVGVKTNNEAIYASGIFVNIGFEPSVNLLKSLNINMDKNYILVDKNMETNLNGIYACGDIIKKDLYQIVTAVSEGAIAATHCYKNLNK